MDVGMNHSERAGEDAFDYEAIEREVTQGTSSSAEDDSELLLLVEAYDWAGTLSRIASHPEEAVSTGIQGRTPLHVACENDAPPVVVQALLEAYPQSASIVGTSNMTPLHIACSSQHASVHVIRTLLEGGSGVETSMRDVDGDTPLHAACRCGAPVEVLEVLLRAAHHPAAVVHERDYEGLTPLLRLWVRYFVMLGDDVIEAVRDPSDMTGELHEAWEKTQLLLRAAHHGSLGAADVVFRAVHAASAVDCPRAVVKIATILHPSQLLEKDEKGCLPLGIAASAPIFRVRDLSSGGYSLEDRIHGDDTGDGGGSNDEEDGAVIAAQPCVVEILLSASPEAARVPDAEGRFPLHVAIASGKQMKEGIEHIVAAYPNALTLPDPVTRLFPFMLAATAGESQCNTTYELLRLNPSLVQGALQEL